MRLFILFRSFEREKYYFWDGRRELHEKYTLHSSINTLFYSLMLKYIFPSLEFYEINGIEKTT